MSEVPSEVREAMARAWREGRDHAVRQIEQQIMDGYPKRLPLGEKCPHSVLNGHDCIGCYDEALMTRLTAIRQNDPTPTILDAALSPPAEADKGSGEAKGSPQDRSLEDK